ncbi:putative oxidoreductase [Xylariaceae sp. FL1019]|nr:putative oxidoreductase [Xylariaceae sp. FL1019]
MRVFVTGSTGFVGTAVVKELVSHGHQVIGLTRNEKGVAQLKAQGAESLVGDITDLECLKKGATGADAVAHLAFVHNFADFAGSCATDRAAITAMGDVLAEAGGDKALVITSGTMMLPQGEMGDEDTGPNANNPLGATRGKSEAVCNDYAKKGIRTSVVRLPPTTHGPGSSGFTGMLVTIALQKGVSAYVGDGQNHWAAGHRDDAAKIFRLAIEKGKPGQVYHAVAEEQVTIKDIATEIGKQLNIPVESLDKEKAAEHFGFFGFGINADNIASSEKTKERLGWTPTGATVVEDVRHVVEFVKSQPTPAH